MVDYGDCFAYEENGVDDEMSLFDMLEPISDTIGSYAQVPADDVRQFIQSTAINYKRAREDDFGDDALLGAAGASIVSGLYKKQRVRVNALCNSCGATGRVMRNWGGATRETTTNPAKYKVQCQPKMGGCGRRFLMNRDANADGTFTQTDSNFAIDGEKKRCSYKCGKCGQDKKGHVCPGVPSSVVTDDMSRVGAVLLSTKNLLGNAFVPILGEDDGGEDNEDDAKTLSALPLLATIAQSVAPVVAQSVAPVVAQSVAPVVAPPSAPVVAPPSAPVVAPPSAPVVAPPSAPVVAPPSAPVVAEETHADAPDGAYPTLLSLPNANLIDDATQPRTGSVALARLRLSRYKVNGDGSCWVYAMLACAGLCESRNLKCEMLPTPRDRGMDRWCRSLAHLWLYEHQEALTDDDIETLDDLVDKLPRHPMVDDDDFGSFGTINTIMGLAAYLDVSVVCWNKTTMRKSNALQQVIIHLHDEEAPLDMKEVTMSPVEILAFSQSDARVMHIEWNGTNHYAALVGPVPVPINVEQMNALMLTTPVADVNPKSFKPATKKMANVSGWMHLVDLYRTDLALTCVAKSAVFKPLKQLLMLARSNKYHGLLYMVDAKGESTVYYIKFSQDAQLSADDFLHTGDFSCNLYIDKLWQDKVASSMPQDARANDCPCRTCFMQKTDAIYCAACNKSFHAICVGVDNEKLEDDDSWRCAACVE
jgi:hypothetical protein